MYKKQVKKRSLYSLDTFIETVKGMPKYHDISDVMIAGFRNQMRAKDMLYVYDPQDYVKALDHYINH